MNIKTVPGQMFFCVAEEVTRDEIPDFAARSVAALFEALGSAHFQPAGNLHFICPEWKGSEAKSRLILAVPIAEEKGVSAPYFIWKSPPYRCVWTKHTGSMPSLRQAWDDFAAQTKKEAVETRCGWREIYHHFESFDSPNDVTELQTEIK